MFSVPNRIAMEVVFHFLFIKLNADSAKESFRYVLSRIEKCNFYFLFSNKI